MSWLTDRLTTLMEERELSVRAVARQLALERSRMAKIVAGAALPNEDLVKRFARYFGEQVEVWTSNAPRRDDARSLDGAGWFSILEPRKELKLDARYGAQHRDSEPTVY
ncbi:MAG: helix-turn-helix domain-containing protein [Phenylobacterium sp.]|uniref:helix-turn-helix domain-containing protein n=1 Tax=Phenylobacterium sp. TaxID=1871053 RepID=UPI0027335512|nr:helix-turn-helix domain-containing protein [Phenylobacterium sp.]MDP3173664.1 helix-turn-helix domain-containing protein [Phenylobacterium sp.]